MRLRASCPPLWYYGGWSGGGSVWERLVLCGPEPGGQHWYRPWDLEEIRSRLPALVSCPVEITVPTSESYREENHRGREHWSWALKSLYSLGKQRWASQIADRQQWCPGGTTWSRWGIIQDIKPSGLRGRRCSHADSNPMWVFPRHHQAILPHQLSVPRVNPIPTLPTWR